MISMVLFRDRFLHTSRDICTNVQLFLQVFSKLLIVMACDGLDIAYLWCKIMKSLKIVHFSHLLLPNH